MFKMPDYIGPMAFGLKMGVILPGMDIVEKIYESLVPLSADGFLTDTDVICITESVVARAQDNYITVDDIAREMKRALKLKQDSKVAVIFPMASRNRFSMLLKGIARAVPAGEVVVQFSYPHDEVGNQVIEQASLEGLGEEPFTGEDIKDISFKHPVTGIDYINFYREIITEEGAKPNILLSNNPLHALDSKPGGVIVADVHKRLETKKKMVGHFKNTITLGEIFNEGAKSSTWGLLGSNKSAGERIKLAPRDGQQVVESLQKKVAQGLGHQVQVMIYGDGAYLDPTSGIYELADPKATFAATTGLGGLREGLKYKYLADHCYLEDKKSLEEIESILAESLKQDIPEDSLEKEGTTPRKMDDVLASLADLVSGSSDAGTPVVIIKGFIKGA